MTVFNPSGNQSLPAAYSGQDQVLTEDHLAQWVADGRLRYFYWGGTGGMGGQASVTHWVSQHCRVVSGFETATRNAGAPDGTAAGLNPTAGQMQVSLYDCAADAGS